MASAQRSELSSDSLTAYLKSISANPTAVTEAARKATTDFSRFLKDTFQLSEAQERSITRVAPEAWATVVWQVAFWLNQGYRDLAAHYLSDGKRCRINIRMRRRQHAAQPSGRIIIYEGDGWRIGIEGGSDDGGWSVDVFVEIDK